MWGLQARGGGACRPRDRRCWGTGRRAEHRAGRRAAGSDGACRGRLGRRGRQRSRHVPDELGPLDVSPPATESSLACPSVPELGPLDASPSAAASSLAPLVSCHRWFLPAGVSLSSGPRLAMQSSSSMSCFRIWPFSNISCAILSARSPGAPKSTAAYRRVVQKVSLAAAPSPPPPALTSTAG